MIVTLIEVIKFRGREREREREREMYVGNEEKNREKKIM